MKGFDKLKYRIFRTDKEYPWLTLEDHWPEDPDEEFLFWNEYTGSYSVTSINKIELSYKISRQEIDTIIDLLKYTEDSAELDFLLNEHSYTHYSNLPLPPPVDSK